MPNQLDPIVGQWYVHRDKGEMFRVVAVDAADGYVETQTFDGDVEELDRDAWREMAIEKAEAPEDWTGPFDEIEPDDLGLSDTCMTSQDWRESLETLRLAEDSWEAARVTHDVDDEEDGPSLDLYADALAERVARSAARSAGLRVEKAPGTVRPEEVA